MATRIPDTMKAVAFEKFGGPEVIRIKNVRVPEIGDDEILIRLDAAGVGAWDPWEREGQMAEMIEGGPRFPYIPGSDGAGEVIAVGAKVRRFRQGDYVYAFGFANPKGGTYAEFAALPAQHAAPIPRGMEVYQAAALAVDGVTALRGLDLLKLQPEQPLLLVGASGGIGHIALQLARQMEVNVLAIGSRHDGVDLVRRLGANAAVEGHDTEAVLEACGMFAPNGFDAALVLACDDTCQRALRHVRDGGRIAYPHGVQPRPEGGRNTRILAYDGEPDPEVLDRLNALIESGSFHLEINRLYPMEEAAEAQKDVLEHHVGKLALKIH